MAVRIFNNRFGSASGGVLDFFSIAGIETSTASEARLRCHLTVSRRGQPHLIRFEEEKMIPST